nr:hypothetical protein [Tanacetum cinerariifolium]
MFPAVLFGSCCWNKGGILELPSKDLSRILKLTLSNSRLGEDCWELLKQLRFVPTDRVIQFLLMALCVPASSSSCDSADHIEAVPAAYVIEYALRDRGIDARVIVEAVDQDEIEMGVRGPVEVKVERITHIGMTEDIPEPAQEGAVEGHRIVGVESAVTALTKKVAELERDNIRLRGTASVESRRVDRLQRGMSRMQREMRQMRQLPFYDRVRVGKLEAYARKHMGYHP